MPVLTLLVILLALVGHTVWILGVVNRTHAYGWNRKLVDLLTLLLGLILLAVPAWAVLVTWRAGDLQTLASHRLLSGYGWAMVAVALGAGLHCTYLCLHPERRGSVLERNVRYFNFGKQLGWNIAKPLPRFFCRLPGNQTLSLAVEELRIAVPNLPAELAGLKIAHLTDLHLSGRYDKSMYQEIVKLANQWQPDLVALTGDLVEKPACFAWIPDVYGALQAKSGCYFVLGNHDTKSDSQAMRRAIAATGAIDLGSTCVATTLRGHAVQLAGNELPWFGPAGEFPDEPAFRIVLAHGPDQFAWAQQHQANLMLAGHNHGGQVRLPGIGALLTPSRTGTRYTCGTFRSGQTVMHVSRGTGSLAPLRWGCPPELTLLTLASA